MIVWNKKVVLFNARIEKDNILYEKYSTNFHEKAQRKERDSARSTSPVRKENVTKSEEEPERGRNGCPCRWRINRNRRCLRLAGRKARCAATGMGRTRVGDRATAGSVCTHPAGRCDCFVGDRPGGAQRLLDAMLQAGALEEKEGWYQIAK